MMIRTKFFFFNGNGEKIYLDASERVEWGKRMKEEKSTEEPSE
jgi:hypothetical protein